MITQPGRRIERPKSSVGQLGGLPPKPKITRPQEPPSLTPTRRIRPRGAAPGTLVARGAPPILRLPGKPPQPLGLPDDTRLDELNPDNLRRTESRPDEFSAGDDDIRATDTTKGGKPPKPFDRRSWRKSVTKGSLREEIDEACEDTGMTLKQLTVLSDDLDPYRFDTPAGHRDGQWFGDQVERFVAADGEIHLRGLHYRISSHSGIARPNGRAYVNDDDTWRWLVNEAANAALWLQYVPFERIRDERNAEPDSYILEDYTDTAEGSIDCGDPPLPPEIVLPQPTATQLQPRQPYRIILIGEKSSLHGELSPVARAVEGELILPTGELSRTRVHEMVKRIEADGRPAVIIDFSDFDPSGWQMPISVARKVQALITLLYPGLDVRLIRGGLTLDQAENYDLPSTPLKETEKRGTKWKEATGREQTELDALIALHPGTLQQIARDAVAPFYDATLNERCEEAVDQWLDEAQQRLETSPGFQPACSIISEAHQQLAAAMQTYNAEVERARTLLPVIDDEIEAPEAEIDEDDQPEALFTTDDDFVEATEKLIASKNLRDV